jgi:N-ethylmaleimide reductase
MTATATAVAPLFTPLQVGAVTAPNRIFLAPMTRNRAPGTVPTDLMAEYYAQRASGGLLITEATQVAEDTLGYPDTPGIFNAEQIAAWKRVTDAVHARGGRIFTQIWHCGRVAHPTLNKGKQPLAPSAVRANIKSFTGAGMEDSVTPRALEIPEIKAIVQLFAQAARNAREAGFDGVEIHGANGYLIDQFLRSGTNHRTDEYGGSAENRACFLLEIVEAASAAWSPDRVGVRISPFGTFNDMSDANPVETFSTVARLLAGRGLAYLHVVDPIDATHGMGASQERITPVLKSLFGGVTIANGGFDLEKGNAEIAAGGADAVSYGVPFLANPDLPARYAKRAELNTPDQATFYGGGAQGYTSYPALSA